MFQPRLFQRFQKPKTVVDFLFVMLSIGAFSVLAWMTTLRTVNPELSTLALYGLGIGLVGVCFSLLLREIMPYDLIMPPTQFMKDIGFNGLIISLLMIGSFVLQFGATFFGHSTVVHELYEWSPAYANLFYCSMAVIETWFFNVLMYRFLKFLFTPRGTTTIGIGTRARGGSSLTIGSVLLANILTAVTFAFAYHFVVYKGDWVWMTCAFIGCFFYNLALEVTQLCSSASLIHIAQNFRV